MDASDFRAEFPVLERVVYLNTGTDGPVPRRGHDAANAQLRYELEQGRLGRPFYDRLQGNAAALRERLAAALGCEPADVALSRSTTDGVSTVLSALRLGRGDEVLTSDVEHPGLLAPLELARRRAGFEVRFVPFDELAGEVGPRTKLVACSHVCWADGRVADVDGLKAAGASVLFDGAQGLGAVPVDVHELGCDFYAASGQKWLCGPDGSGSLYVRREVADTLDPPWPSYASLAEPGRASELIPHPGARRFDMGVASGPPTAWSLAALELLQEAGLDWVTKRAAESAGRLAAMLAERGLEVAPRGRTTLVSWRSETAEEDVARLLGEGISVRFLPGLDLVRASVGAWTSDDDLERLVRAVVA
ncbi:MAG: L-cysteine/cystine lyase [Thermoleophilaceae bacterium]|jgi:L-cysteine/cystine lyase|nr:L-cysteine/cystine lyase [Thermoleophilaceae bacterium]